MKVPIGCRERHEFICQQAKELADQFHNGNRNDVRDRLKELPPAVSLAVLATMMEDRPKLAGDLANYLREVA